jgi:hypothetical protein
MPHTQKVRAALGDGHLWEGPEEVLPKMDEGERAVMGWIYFAEEVAPGRNLLRE